MAVTLTTQLFDAFLGTQEGIHSIILPDIFSSGGSKNLFIDKYGRAKKIDGYEKQNAGAITTDTGASATMVRSLTPYRKTGGGSVTRVLMGAFDDQTDEFELKKSTDGGANWTHITDLGAGSINSIPDWAQFGDTIYFTNGVIAPAKYDNTTWSTAGRSQSPTITSASASAAGNLSGNFQWKLISIIDGARQAGSASSTSLPLTNDKGSLSWTADADVNVDGYELYRTTGTGAVFYFVDYIDGRLTTSHTDNVADIDILENRVMEEHGDSPPSGAYYCEPHKQRMWWARTDAAPTRAYWSDPALPEDVLGDNFLDFSDSETVGDQITGMLGNYEGRLVVFTERAVWAVSGTGEVIGNILDWSRIKTNAQTGAVSGRTVARIPAGAKFSDQNGEVQATGVVTLAYLTPNLDIRLFDGDNDIVISHPVGTTLAGITDSSAYKSVALLDLKRSEVSWSIPTASGVEPNTSVVWNYRWGVWYTREWGFSSLASIETASEFALLVGGSNSTATGGFVYELWAGNDFDGSAIESVWMTKTLHGVNEAGQPAMSQTKRWRWGDFIFEADQTTTLTVEWLEGFAADDGSAISSKSITPAASGILTADGDTVQDASGNDIVVGQESSVLRAKFKDSTGDYLEDTGMRLRVGDNASVGSWALEAMNLAYQILPGLQRRMQ